jgi:hypothetical protein
MVGIFSDLPKNRDGSWSRPEEVVCKNLRPFRRETAAADQKGCGLYGSLS